jgi:hypothetical protein
MSNPCAKKVTPEQAYEVWQHPDGFTYYVLKKYQTPEMEAKNLYARWYCLVTSPVVPNGEYGDCYAADIKARGRKIPNPRQKTGSHIY